MKLPPSLQGVSLSETLTHLYYKTKGMIFRSLWHKLWHPRNTCGLALIHSSVEIYYSSLLHCGRWVVLHRNGKLNALSRHGVHLGERVTIGDNFWVQGTSHLSNPGDTLVIGDRTYIGPNAILGFHGPVKIGRDCAIGANFQISAQSHDLASGEKIATATVTSRGITIGDCCWIGNDVKILDGVTVGARAVIGAGSVVIRDVQPDAVVAGIPAKPLKSIESPA
jgi:acetyltransferase-like isoleucine patch superfamily enzyme